MQSKIVKTLKEVLDYLPVMMTTDIAVVDPFFSNVERSFVISIIGKEQFIALVSAYSAADGIVEAIVDEDIKLAITLLQKIVVTIGYYKAIPVLSVKIGASGMQVLSTADTKQAFNWQVDEVKKSLLDLGYGAVEDLLSLFEESPDKFTEYMDSEQFIAANKFLIEKATDFDVYFNIKRSRLIFSSISYIMLRIENQVVKKIFGTDFFEGLKSDNLVGKSKILVDDYIKPGIALLTAEKAIKERVITFENGVASINLMGNYESVKANIPATQIEIKNMSEQLITDGNQFLQDGLQFILDNKSDFADFTVPNTKSQYSIKNNPDGGVYAL